MPVGKVSHVAELRKTIGSLYMDEELFDVSIKVEDEVFPAHRVILSAQSKYFKQLLYGKKKTEVTLNNTPAEVFRDILAYFYTGDLDLQNPSEEYVSTVLRLAKQYQLHALQRDVVDDMCAKLLVDEPLASADLEFYDLEADNLLKTDLFLSLDPKRVKELLSRDTFHVDREIYIFRAAVRWSKARPAEEKTDVMDNVRLPCIEQQDLISEVLPQGVYTAAEVCKAMTEQLIPANLKRRAAKAATLKGQNVALSDLGAEVITDAGAEYFLQDAEESEELLSHRIQPCKDQAGIVVKLDTVYNLNHITFSISSKDTEMVSYYVETRSQGEGPWKRVIDFSDYRCRGKQLLYFEPVAVKYIKLIGTWSTENPIFSVKALKCFYMETTPKVTHGIIEPVENQAMVKRDILLMSGTNPCTPPFNMLDGIDTNSKYTHCKPGECIKVSFPQPLCINSMRMRILDGYSCSFQVEVSTDNLTWTEVANMKSVQSWQKITFEKQVVSCIKLVVPKDSNLYIVYFECPDTTDQ